MTDVIARRIEEHPVEGRRLGRHVRHDPRSRDFLADEASKIVTTIHGSRGLPLAQTRGSCTAEALCGALDSDPNLTIRAGWVLLQPDAESLYDQEIVLEGGDPKSDDPGGDGITVCKAAQKMGLIREYRHTFSLEHALLALVLRPVIIGINWWDSFDQPDPTTGLIVKAAGAAVRGGHEVLADSIDAEAKTIGLWNSWGGGYGLAGRFFMTWDLLGELLGEQGDVTVPVL